MARITILTVGSRGDVQPYVALGLGLKAAGHSVAVATADQFAGFVTKYGLEHRPVSAEFLELANSKQGAQALSGKASSRLSLMRQVMPMLRRMLEHAWRAAQDSQAIIYHPKAMGGYHIAEKLNIPGFLAIAVPAFSPTGQFANPLLTTANLGPILNRWTHQFLMFASIAPYRSLINQWRKDTLGLPPFKDDSMLRGQPVPKLYFYSPQLVSTPVDWDSASAATGFWFLNQQNGWQPSPELARFLEAGPAPVYVGFGSMPAENAEAKARVVVEAVRQASQRAVLATGWGGLAAQNGAQDIFALDAAPHDWLFPRMAAVVHHGGAGTTGEGLRAGKPTIICPFFGDQPFWGKRVAALGVGPEPIPQKQLTAERLAQAIRAATDAGMRARAEVLGAKIKAENGVQRAVEIITRQLAT
jgi:sterol 3beta-glucosyltransferase